jgi:branched-chain amino acid transport system substrate-binding protein
METRSLTPSSLLRFAAAALCTALAAPVLAAGARRAATKAEPGTPEFRLALRDAIHATRELAGTHGVFTFKPNEPNGLDKRSAVVVRLDKGQWKLVP